ncbi:hypothetical protein B0H16DRAFT_1544757 [Mycena metata]|uniref:MACPF domain-containing protein n=1 Tax=Mycena metata TaxID=1033252 RepID=A0AAD7IYG2_9AGAR|nr:hypothetical protein B0H16DRAFT_1544757 [Mycena metata]
MQPLPLHTVDGTFSESQIYCNQLLPLRRGFPLYIPGPSEMLPAESQTSGVQIGDVGTVTPEGLFRCFFNIYLPADHPVNLDNVPDDFHPLEKYNERDLLTIHRAPGNHVSTSSVHKIIHDGQLNQFPGGDFVFSCRPPQGAVLALPHGAEFKRLEDIETVRKYAQKYAKTWYAHLKHTKRRVVENGSLYLITGCEKVMSWGMATYHSTRYTDEFEASFRPTQTNANPQYQWMGSGRFPAQHQHYNRPAVTNDTSNQTVFIHGLSISLGAGIWNRLFGSVKITTIEEYLLGRATRIKSNLQPTLLSSSLLGSSSRGISPRAKHLAQRTQNANSAEPPRPINIFHPGRLINAFLIYMMPGAEVVTTHDDDWADSLAQDPSNGPRIETVSDFLEYITQEFNITERDGGHAPCMVFLARKQRNEQNVYHAAELRNRQAAADVHNEEPVPTEVQGPVAAELPTEGADHMKPVTPSLLPPSERISELANRYFGITYDPVRNVFGRTNVLAVNISNIQINRIPVNYDAPLDLLPASQLNDNSPDHVARSGLLNHYSTSSAFQSASLPSSKTYVRACVTYDLTSNSTPMVSEEMKAIIQQLPIWSSASQEEYNEFFETHGTYVVTRVALGGLLRVVLRRTDSGSFEEPHGLQAVEIFQDGGGALAGAVTQELGAHFRGQGVPGSYRSTLIRWIDALETDPVFCPDQEPTHIEPLHALDGVGEKRADLERALGVYLSRMNPPETTRTQPAVVSTEQTRDLGSGQKSFQVMRAALTNFAQKKLRRRNAFATGGQEVP